jgi:hypothetical protein
VEIGTARRSGYEVDVTDTPSGKEPVSVQELIWRIKAALPEWKQFTNKFIS